MKKILKKHLYKNDSGIAIMFSLMMMAVFLVLGMGFSAYMSNIRRAAEYQKQSRSNDDTMDMVSLQITDVIESGFEKLGSYPDNGTSNTENYSPSMPEASPDRFDGEVTFTYTTNGGTILMPSTGDNIEYPLWGVKTDDPNEAVADEEINFNMFIGNSSAGLVAEEKPDVSITTSSFTSPVGGHLGWQVHKDFQGTPQAISTWAIIGMSGRLDPVAYSNIASTPTSRATGENINEMSVADIISDTDTLAIFANTGTGSASLAGFHELAYDPSADDSNTGTLDDTTYFSFFPMGSNYNIELLNESDVLETTDKAMTSDTDSSNDVTLFDLSEIFTDNTITPEVIIGTSGSKPLTYLTNASSTIPEEQRLQIAANLVDYIDADSTPSTDYDGSDRSTLTYMGNEKTPVINEVTFDISFTYDAGAGEYTINFNTLVELLNMYEFNPGISPKHVTFTADLSFTIVDSVNGKTIVVDNETYTFTVDASGTTYTTPSYNNTSTTTVSGGSDPLNSLTTYDISGGDSFDEMSNFSMTNISPIQLIGPSDELWDLAQIDNGSISYTQGTVNTSNRYITLQCSDPKLNHDSSQWTTTTGSTNFEATATHTSLAVNNSYSPSGDYDNDASDPKDLSTNYVRNEKILNLHELGYIHRGVPYQTLNLIEYNTETPETISAYTNTNGDTLYNTSNNFADLSNGGDRSILDYVSLGSGIEITGSLEETTPPRRTKDAIFKHIQRSP